MKKVSLLAASVAFALTGCGGSDGDSSGATPGGVVITGFDGYFNQAIAFQDTNNNGELDIDTLGTEGADLVFGLTDANGQITVPNSIEGALALQTLTPGGTVQQALIAHNNDEFEVAGKYTIDMDHPSQAMAHELVFRAPTSSNVISPITDLVAIEAEKNGGDLEAAETAVNVALGGTDSEPVALYDDFVEGDNADAELHKTAQILTESKAANPTTYEEKSDQFAKEANALVDTLTPAELADNDLKPVIEDNAAPGEDLDPIVVTNNKLVVTASVLETEQGKIPTLEENGSSSNIVLDIAGLFVDKDQTLITPNLTHNIPAESGIVVTLNGDILTLVASDYIGTSGEFTVTLTAEDKNSTPEIVGSAIAIFNVKIEAANQIPAVDYDEYDVLQAEINNWQLEVGVPFEQTINIENLFTDKDGDIVSYRTGGMTIPGLTVSPQEGTNPIITISGTPTKATATDASEAFMVGGVDNEGAAAYQEMLMPQVQEGTPVEPPQPELGFTQAHFDKGGVWQMGSFDYGDGEFAFASLRNIDGTHNLCWTSDDSSDNSTLTRDDWLATFDYQAAEYKANNGNVIGGDDCMPATLNDDGTLEVEGDEPGSITTISMVYQHITKNNDYQIIMTMDEVDGTELFWLDSTSDDTGSVYNTFAQPNPSNRPVGDQYTEFLLTDDATADNEIEPLLDQFDYTVTKTSGFDSETILAEGTYRASSVSFPAETWAGDWAYEEVPPTGGLSYVVLPEFNDDVNRDIQRRYFTYRDFGDIQIGVGDNDKDAQWGRDLGDFGFFFIASENKEIIKSINDAWTK